MNCDLLAGEVCDDVVRDVCGLEPGGRHTVCVVTWRLPPCVMTPTQGTVGECRGQAVMSDNLHIVQCKNNEG